MNIYIVNVEVDPCLHYISSNYECIPKTFIFSSCVKHDTCKV